MVENDNCKNCMRREEENSRLKKLLTQYGITWEEQTAPAHIPVPTESAPAQAHFTTDDKIALFRRLFRGGEDVYPQRWESAKGTSGYSPACGTNANAAVEPWGIEFAEMSDLYLHLTVGLP